MSTASPPPHLAQQRHPSLYFEDGDIVLIARESPTADHLFRVHRALLCHHSEVFRSMFVVGNGDNAVHDDAPLVRMPDSASDVAAILSSIYNAPYLLRTLIETPRANTVLKLAGLMDMGKKYMLHDVVDAITLHTIKQWPQSLDEWDIRDLESQKLRTLALPEPASAIQFATKYDITSILPAAFYALASTSTESEWDEGAADKAGRMARWSLLDGRNAMRFARGRDRLISFYTSEIASWYNPCIVHPVCISTGKSLVETTRVQSSTCPRDCLRTLTAVIAGASNSSLCATSKPALVSKLQKIRTEIWERLPDFFDLR